MPEVENKKKTGIIAAIGQAIYDVRIQIEYRIIIPIIEGFVRIWYHLDPRVYSERLRIKEVTEGNVEKKSDRYVIFVLYARASLPSFTINMIEAIDRTDLNLIIVVNSETDAITKARLTDVCHLYIERSNLGRDFGAHRDAFSILQRRVAKIDRLILLNDSLFFFRRGLSDFLSQLNGNQDFIGVTEVFQFHYHVQSYALSFGSRVVNNRRFRKFWKKYRPISSRRWSIHRGEVTLTRRLIKAGFRPYILFQAAELRLRLGALPIREILEATHLLPTFFRAKLYQEVCTILAGSEDEEALSAIEVISEGIKSVNAMGPDDVEHGALGTISGQAKAMERWSYEILASKIVSIISQTNQMHVGGFFFMKYMGLPVIKRDIFYRDVYTLEDVYRILTEFGEPLRDEALADLRRSGTAMYLNPFMKMLFRHGSI